MSATIDFHGPYTFEVHHYAAGTVEYHPAPYTSVGITDSKGNHLTLYFTTTAQADAFIKAGIAALDLLTQDAGGAS